MFRCFLCSLAILFVSACSTSPADDPEAARTEAPKEAKTQLNALLAEFNGGVEQIRQEMLKTMTVEEVNNTLWSTGPFERMAHLGPRLLALGRQNPRTDVGWEAVRWVVYVRGFSKTDKATALEQMLRDHIDEEEFYNDLYFHLTRPGVDQEAFYRAVLARPDAPRRVAGLARFSLAKWLLTRTSGKEAEALRLFHQVRTAFADLPHPYDNERGTLGDAAERAQFEIEHLQVGKEAPEITGADVDGKPFRLGDYRGKVVVLVFCGDWCGPCRTLYPHEKELVEKRRDQPFAIVGVNSDAPEILRKAIQREGFPFRWFCDGSTRGPISSRWNVETWPTIYVLDTRGTIRMKKIGALNPEQIDETVGQLLSEAGDSRP